MEIKITYEGIVSTAAFLISVYATWTTQKFNQNQKKLIETQEKLNHLSLEKEADEKILNTKADLRCDFIKIGSSRYRLKVWNQGRSIAKDIRLEFPEGNEVIPDSEIRDKFPLEILNPHQSIELIAAIHLGIKSKHVIKINWSDDFDRNNEKICHSFIS